MLKKIKEIFGTNEFIPTTEIFPRIDVDRLKEQLEPRKRGIRRGKDEFPKSSSTLPDSVENEIIKAVDDLRQLSIQEFHNHSAVYEQRLARIPSIRTLIESSASKAPNKFESDSQKLETRLQGPMVQLKECVVSKFQFRKKHEIKRVVHHHRSGGIRWLALGFLMVLIESVLNGYLFAQKNEFGLLGGGFAAALISIANVGVSSISGYYSRFKNHINSWTKLYGFLLLMVWSIFIVAFNFSVAHFRDGMVSGLEWNMAAEKAVERIATAPLDVASIESWLLITIGSLISVVALLKAYYADDPYPGYGNTERLLEDARERYEKEHDSALDELERERDRVVDELREAEELVHLHSNESTDALYGHKSLYAQLSAQLAHCDSVVQQLLQIYRDSNEEYRSTSSPEYFKEQFKFKEFIRDESNQVNTDKLQEEIGRIESMVSSGIKEINEHYGKSIDKFPSARKIEDSALAEVYG